MDQLQFPHTHKNDRDQPRTGHCQTIEYCKGFKYWDRSFCANSASTRSGCPYKSSLIKLYTVCHSFCIFLTRYPDISPPGHFPPCSNQVGRTIPPLFLAGLGHFPSCNIIRGGHFPSHLFAQRGHFSIIISLQ